jgi:ATP-dependent DNA helicase RecQ
MGINKPNVRWVIHYDLPKNIESYYQETGRAGRDGLPSDCLLLFSAGDAAKQSHFIDDITDEHERSVARTQLRQMLHYAESAGCRRGELLTYFAETYPEANCASCDNCIEPRDTYDGTILAQKFLSCVYRVAQASRFGTGANHLVEILTGADTEKIRRWGHDQLSTYGIGKDLSRPHWLGVFRELMRLGYLRQTEGQYPTIEMTEAGAEILRARSQIMLTKPMTVIKTAKVRIKRKGAIECDEILFARLRALRKELADEKGVPAYVIFGDATLRQMAREYPETINAMHDIFGMGEKKREQYGDFFAAEIANHLQDNAKMAFN